MPRRYIDYPDAYPAGTDLLDRLLRLGRQPPDLLLRIFEAFAKKRVAGDNPWGQGAETLEWQLSSPPPYHQWEQLPASSNA